MYVLGLPLAGASPRARARRSPLPALQSLVLVAVASASATARAGAEPTDARADVTDARADVTAEHVRRVAQRLGEHLPRLAERPEVEVVELAAVVAGPSPHGTVQVSTGLLRALRSDAELAMVLGYELCRSMPAEAEVSRRTGPSVAAEIGRAAGIGAATGAVAGAVWDAVDEEASAVSGAVAGAAVAATGTLVGAAFDRRGSHELDAADDAAVADGTRALLSAGYDGKAALQGWSSLSAAAAWADTEDGGYADADANRRRQRVASKVMKKAPRSWTARVGRAEYEHEVLAPLSHGVVPDGGLPAPASPRAPSPPARSPNEPAAPSSGRAPSSQAPWVVYDRSGGITGWRARVEIEGDGAFSVVESRHGKDSTSAPRRLTSQELDELTRWVDQVASAPDRPSEPGSHGLRDGQVRLLTVTSAAGSRVVVLSDGLVLTESDGSLIRFVEELVTPR